LAFLPRLGSKLGHVGSDNLPFENELSEDETCSRALRDTPTAESTADEDALDAWNLADNRPSTVGDREEAGRCGLDDRSTFGAQRGRDGSRLVLELFNRVGECNDIPGRGREGCIGRGSATR
jgi:hypothetical protein